MTDDRWDEPTADVPSREPVSARGRRTRAKLLESGREALADRGHTNTRVDDVVSRAGTSHGTFYLYFENVEDLLAAVVEQCDDEAAALLDALAANQPGDTDGAANVLAQFNSLRQRYGDIASPWVQPAGAEQSRVATLSAHLDGSQDRAIAVLAMIDRVLPELATHVDGTRRVAALIDGVRSPVAAQTAPVH